MKTIKNVIRLAAVAIMMASCQGNPGIDSTALYTGGSSTANGSPNSATTTPGGIQLDAEEARFLVLINDYRAQNGAPALQVVDALQADAAWMATDMASKSYLNHTDSMGRDPFTRMQAFGFSSYSTAGENIADGNATADATFTQWRNSAGHNANMLNAAYKYIGIGRANSSSSSYGWYWSTPFGG